MYGVFVRNTSEDHLTPDCLTSVFGVSAHMWWVDDSRVIFSCHTPQCPSTNSDFNEKTWCCTYSFLVIINMCMLSKVYASVQNPVVLRVLNLGSHQELPFPALRSSLLPWFAWLFFLTPPGHFCSIFSHISQIFFFFPLGSCSSFSYLVVPVSCCQSCQFPVGFALTLF